MELLSLGNKIGSPFSFVSSDSKKSVIILLRWSLIITTGYLILFHRDPDIAPVWAHSIILLLLLTNFIVSALPARLFHHKNFDACLVIVDIVLISLSVIVTGAAQSDFFFLYFLIIMIAALGDSIQAIIIVAGLVAIVYTMVVGLTSGFTTFFQSVDAIMHVPFFIVAAIFYGYLAQMVREERDQKLAYRYKLGVAGKLRELSTEIATSLDRKQILSKLVKYEKEFCEASFVAVISRARKEVLAETGKSKVFPVGAQLGVFFDDLESIIGKRQKEKGASKVGSPMIQKGFNQVDMQTDIEPLVIGNFHLMSFTGAIDSELYLVMHGVSSDDTLEYAKVLLLSATMALNNAGQYKALVQEVEKRQHLVRQLGEALEFKSEFLANITHELRTPIHCLLGYAELLAEGDYGDLTEEQSDAAQRITDNGHNLLNMINNILDMSKLEAGELKLHINDSDMKEFAEDIVNACMPLLKNKPVALKLICDDSFPNIRTDWSLLRQIALNLVSNAVKFTVKGEIVINVHVNKSSANVEFSVRDTGIGIPEEKQEEIFEAFRQLDNGYARQYGGTGLGLSITKKHVELLKGELTLVSVLGEGSNFTVILPVRYEDLVMEERLLSAEVQA